MLGDLVRPANSAGPDALVCPADPHMGADVIDPAGTTGLSCSRGVIFATALLSLLLLLLAGRPAVAQQGIVTGTVLDLQTGAPLSGALVQTDAGLSGLSDEQGRFRIELRGPERMLSVYLLGYKPATVDLTHGTENLRVRLEISPVQMSEVHVAGYGANRRLLETAGGVAVIPAEALERGNPTSMQHAFESVPGVRMEMSNPNQQRLSIRGVGVRAHQSGGVRTFLNGIPITDAEGGTNFAQVDVTTLGQIEVLKGPSSSLFGAGLGGVVHLQTRRAPYQQQIFEIASIAGSDGLQRFGGSYQTGSNAANLSMSYGYYDYDGFREHDRHARKEFNAFGEFFASDRSTISVLATRTESKAQLAGGVTEQVMRENPRAANGTSVRQNVNQNNIWTRIGVSHTYNFSDRFTNTSTIHNTFGEMDHPVSSAVLRNTTHTVGARTAFTYRAPASATMAPRASVGAEYLRGLTLRKRYENPGGGEAGALIGDTEQTTPVLNLFAQIDAELGARTTATVGLSYNRASLRVLDLYIPTRSGERVFDPVFSPRIALNHRITDHISAHASVSHGYLPPSASQTIAADGAVNRDLSPETATNYELGVRGLVFEDRLNFDASIFSLRMNDELIPRTVDQGVTEWVNAGRTLHNGFETAVSWAVIQNGSGILTALTPFATYAYSDFSFEEFVIGDVDYSGNTITGTAPHVVHLGIDASTRPGFYGSVRYSYTDRMPLNDTNTDYASSYSLVSGRIGLEWEIGRTGIDAHVGIDNLFDTRYASRLDFNASGGNYYRPSPGRTFYTGVTLRPRF